MKGKLAIVALLPGLFLPGGWAQNNLSNRNSGSEKDSTAVSPLSDPKVSATISSVSAIGAGYVIGPNDILQIAVWKEPDFTITVPVRTDGMISVPLLNDVLAAGLTPIQLTALLTQKLKKYIEAPRVTVIVTQTNPRRIYVLGEVQHSGAISLLPDMTVLQALATAGFTQFANTKRIYILRTTNGQQKKIPFNYKHVIKGEETSQNILLEPGDTIVVP